MTRNAWFHLAIALLAVAAIGMSATTFDSTVETDANDVIDLDYDQVPIGQEQASDVVDRVEQARDPQSDETAELSRADPDASSDPTAEDSTGEAGAAANARSQQEMDRSSAGGQSSQDGESQAPTTDGLLDLLLDLLPTLLVLAAFLAGVTAIVHYGQRLDDWLAGAGEEQPTEPSLAETPGLPGRPPANAVEHAWASMVGRLDLSRSVVRTPNECAAAAIEAGFDRETVERLTEAFVEVRYGEQPVTEHRERIARQSTRRFGGGT